MPEEQLLELAKAVINSLADFPSKKHHQSKIHQAVSEYSAVQNGPRKKSLAADQSKFSKLMAPKQVPEQSSASPDKLATAAAAIRTLRGALWELAREEYDEAMGATRMSAKPALSFDGALISFRSPARFYKQDLEELNKLTPYSGKKKESLLWRGAKAIKSAVTDYINEKRAKKASSKGDDDDDDDDDEKTGFLPNTQKLISAVQEF